jgi:hypothetical protein
MHRVAVSEPLDVEFSSEGIFMTIADLLRTMALAITWTAYVLVSALIVIALLTGWPAVLHGPVSPYQ